MVRFWVLHVYVFFFTFLSKTNFVVFEQLNAL